MKSFAELAMHKLTNTLPCWYSWNDLWTLSPHFNESLDKVLLVVDQIQQAFFDSMQQTQIDAQQHYVSIIESGERTKSQVDRMCRLVTRYEHNAFAFFLARTFATRLSELANVDYPDCSRAIKQMRLFNLATAAHRSEPGYGWKILDLLVHAFELEIKLTADQQLMLGDFADRSLMHRANIIAFLSRNPQEEIDVAQFCDFKRLLGVNLQHGQRVEDLDNKSMFSSLCDAVQIDQHV